jgi:hypothetical protein
MIRKSALLPFLIVVFVASALSTRGVVAGVTRGAPSDLTVSRAAAVCSHAANSFGPVWIRGYFVSRNVLGGRNIHGGMGGLYARQHRAELRSSDTTPFVLVEYGDHRSTWINSHWVRIHGILNCAPSTLPEVVGTLFADRWGRVGKLSATHR